MLEAFGLMRQHYRREYGAGRLLYKSVPYIYHRQPGCEDEYALFRNGARLVACNLSSTVNLKAPIAYERSRRNALKKAMRRGWTVEASHDFAAYWDILAQPDNQKIVQNVESETYMDDWKKVTRKAAEVAYRRACPAVTARQMEAFAQGFAKLCVPDGKKNKVGGSTDSEQSEGGDHV